MAFIAPEFPKPRTVAERVARLLIPEQSYTLHVYTVLELLEKAYALGRTQRSTS